MTRQIARTLKASLLAIALFVLAPFALWKTRGEGLRSNFVVFMLTKTVAIHVPTVYT